MKECLIGLVLLSIICTTVAFKEDDCEVCVKTVEEFAASLIEEVKQDPKLIEDEFKKYCLTAKSKKQRFCYYLGGLETSATGILNELTKPLSWSLPALKICEKLKKKDGQICDLRFEKQIDLSTVDLKKLKVRDLKKVLNDWDEECDGCLEKTDYIRRIEELTPKYANQAPKESKDEL